MSRFSSAQAEHLRAWLATQEFQATPDDHWSQGDCTVRLTRHRRHFKVGVRWGSRYWVDLDDCISLHAGRAEAATLPPIELATNADFRFDVDHPGRRAPGVWLYRNFKPWAHGLKVLLQMLIGVGAAIDIGGHVVGVIVSHHDAKPWVPAAGVSVTIIAAALAAAAAIDLAYALFTPGPDEALDPLMLGLSSGILLLVTRTDIPVTAQFTGILVGVVALGILFLVRQHLLEDEG